MNRALACSCLTLALSFWGLGCGDDAGAGGEGADDDPLRLQFVSGSRLKIRVLQAGDAQRFNGVIDSELDSACYPAEAEDGSLRCVPSGVARILYADAACTHGVATYYDGGCVDEGPGKYATRSLSSDDVCQPGTRTRVFEIGAELATPPTATFDKDYEGNCYETGSVTTPMFELVAELAPEAMAPLEIVQAPRGEALTMPYYRGDDGFHLVGDYPHDIAHEIDCNPRQLGAVFACAPVGISGSFDNFSDAACTTAGVLGGLPSGCEPPNIAVATRIDDECSYEDHVYERGEALPAFYVEEGGNCVEGTNPSTIPYAVGAELPDSDFAAVELVVQGEGPVRLSVASVADAPISRFGYFVTSDGVVCYPFAFADGTVRCGPSTPDYVPAFGRFFSDSACSEILVSVGQNVCGEAAPELALVATGTPNSCVTWAVYAMGATHTGMVFVDDEVEGCIEIAPDGPVNALGERIPDEEFVEITIETL